MKIEIKDIVETSGILFTVGGGFMAAVSPPTDPNIKFGYSGMGMVFSFLIFFIVKYFVQTIAKKKFSCIYFLILVLTLASLFFISTKYLKDLDRFTFINPINKENKIIVSDTYTPEASRWLEMNPQYQGNHQVIFEKFGDDIDSIWTSNSIRDTRSYLMKLYLLVVILLSISIAFCIEFLSKFVPDKKASS